MDNICRLTILLSCMIYLGKSNQGNQGYSGIQKYVIQGQRPDIENKDTQQRT